MRDVIIKEDKTIRISYSALLTVISGIVMFAAWMTTLQLTAAANTDTIANIQTENKETQKAIINIDKSLTEIKTILKIQRRGN